MYDFSYDQPGTIQAAVAAMGGEDAKALAGGMTFIPVLKQRLNRPKTVVDLSKLGLSGITVDSHTITIVAMTTHAAVAASADVRAKIPALADLAGGIGDIQVRHRGTIGGSLANNDPAACYPSAVLALGATIHTDRRAISADKYFEGMFTTALEPNEIITKVEFPIPEKAAYEKFRNPASRYAIVGAFVAKFASAGVRVAITGAGQGGVFRFEAAEKALSGDFSVNAMAGVRRSPDGLNSDIHASAEYRAHLISVTVKRAVAKAA